MARISWIRSCLSLIHIFKWGVMGTAYIFERDTARGMQLADNCELTAIAGRNMAKAEAFKEQMCIRDRVKYIQG